MTQIIARRLAVFGRVQGVFYRDWTVETATRLGLDGWVRNRMDGSVEIVASGKPAAVEQFLALAHDGPPAAQVSRIDVSSVEAEPCQGFQRRPTA